MNFPRVYGHLPKRSLLLVAAALFVFSLVTGYYFSIQPSVDYQQKSLERYVQKQEKDALQLLQDSSLMRRLVAREESLEEFRMVEGKPYGLFLFAETISGVQDLFFWNNQKILPPTADFSMKDGEVFQRLANGYYVVIKRTLQVRGMSNNIVAYVLIPVLNQYYLEWAYMKSRFVHSEEAINKIDLSIKPTNFPIQTNAGKTLFYVKRVTHSNISITDALSITLRLASLVFLLLYIQVVADTIVKRRRAITGILFLAGVLLLIRVLLYLFPNLFALDQFELFSPLVYSTNWVNRSLGDLLINAFLLCWIVLFSWYNLGPGDKIPRSWSRNLAYLVGFAAVFVLIFATFQLANVVKGLIVNSKISFYVTDFFSLDIYSVVGFIVLALLCLTYYYFTRMLFRIILPAFREHQIYIYFFIALVGLVYLTLRSGNEIVLFHLPVLLWLVIYTLLLSQEKFIINRFSATVAGVLFWIFVFSISLAAVILQGNRVNELRVRKGIAEKMAQLYDTGREDIMSIAITYLDNRFLLNNMERFRDPVQSQFIRDSIVNSNYVGYVSNYDTKIYVFDSANRAVNNNDPATFAELNTIFTLQSKPTKIRDLYYHETSFDHFTYITKREIRSDSALVGSFFFLSTPRSYSNSDALSANLFRSVNRNDPANSPVYSYAIYNNRLLMTASAKYPFQTSLTAGQVPLSEYEQVIKGDYDELWYKASAQKIIVVAKKQDSMLEIITLFSYLFCSFLFMVGLLQAISFLLRVSYHPSKFDLLSHFTIRSQIHGTVIFISVLSFLIIGAATISFFITRYNRNNEERLSRTADIMMKEMQQSLIGYSSSDTSVLNGDSSLYGFTRLVNDVALIHNVDVNIYDLDGNLEVTSSNSVYSNGVLSRKMHPLAFYHLSRLREVQRVQQENISELEYLSIYTAVRDNDGNVIKYLNIPYFSSQLDLNQEISNFLVTIINLNAFIFLIAGIIALFITNKITQSFSVIGDKMRAITLGQTNEEIVWRKNDEIGELVTQYNKMVHELEKSADALARSEREGAWREMARQVAHEIKNPLTPMKLSIQYLQKAINSGHSNVKDLTTSVANTLIEQIDHLSKIAADFSQFANIGNKRIELVDLHQVLGSLFDLHSVNPRVSLEWNKLPGSLVLKADKTQMNRLFTNLLANAVDACADQESCVLSINEVQQDNYVTISITDNGEGIPPSVQEKIFTPNFTTKTSGTGLGLAMCKGIVEGAGGQIWFETAEGKGTTFFVQLPVVT